MIERAAMVRGGHRPPPPKEEDDAMEGCRLCMRRPVTLAEEEAWQQNRCQQRLAVENCQCRHDPNEERSNNSDDSNNNTFDNNNFEKKNNNKHFDNNNKTIVKRTRLKRPTGKRSPTALHAFPPPSLPIGAENATASQQRRPQTFNKLYKLLIAIMASLITLLGQGALSITAKIGTTSTTTTKTTENTTTTNITLTNTTTKSTTTTNRKPNTTTSKPMATTSITTTTSYKATPLRLPCHNFRTVATLTATLALALCLIRAPSVAAASTEQHLPTPLLQALFKSVAGSAAASQRQQQQQQLFSLLNGNRQNGDRNDRPALDQPAAATSGIAGDFHNTAVDEEEAASSLETTGFVADDGQQYEKAERVLAAAASAAKGNNNSNNNQQRSLSSGASGTGGGCPAHCKCLNDYFDCSEQLIERLPEMPNYVRTLLLAGNKLNDVTVLQVRNLSELHKLSLKQNQLETVPVFVGLHSLRHLNLAKNRITRISGEALASLPKLKTLDLSRNHLQRIEMSFFPKPTRLANLILNYNEITNISDTALENLPELHDLELDGNRLESLPAGVFKAQTKLRKLSLNNNRLAFTWAVFKGLGNLTRLSLRGNNIRALQDVVFHIMHAIETIELDDNAITTLNRQSLFNLTKLHTLSLSNNSISRIELDTWEFTQSLVRLNLSHNNISEFKPQHLDCLQRLVRLDLSHNKIQHLADTTFDCAKNLEELNLRRNRLAWVIEDPGAAPPFKALRKLKKLDLFGNNLKQINAKSLSGLVSLESLKLGGNDLASIQAGAFDHMTHLQKLSFKSRNFICDCELLWFRRWLLKSSRHQLAQAKAGQVTAVCGYPEHLLDRELQDLAPAELICADNPKPVITQEPSNQLTVKGTNITMECIANSPAAASMAATDELKIEWSHDSQNVREHRGGTGSSHAASPGNGGGGSSGVMELASLNGLGHKLAPPPPPQQHNHHPQHSNAHYSHSTTHTQVYHDQATNQTTIIGQLRLFNVSYENAGRYQCVVSNAFGTTYSQKFKISIGIHPSFLQIPSNLTIDSGDTARLVCSATGDPLPEIALQKFGSTGFPAATERRMQVFREENATVIVIMNAKPIDTGVYTCSAGSAAGEIKVNASLVVNDKPQMRIPVKHKEIVVGESTVLECLHEEEDSGGSPLSDSLDLGNGPHRTWFKDNKPFHTSATSESERYYFTAERELLIIVKTQSMDAGHYRCEIADNARTHTIETELLVVKADFSENVVIVIVVLVTVACIVIGSLIVWIVLCYQRRKYQQAGSGGGPIAGGLAGGRVAVATASQLMLNGSRGSALDHTALTTLNRTYLQPAGGRPRSLADLDGLKGDAETLEQRGCLLRSGHGSSNTTPTIGGGGVVRGGAGGGLRAPNCLDDVDHVNLEFLRRRNSGSAAAGDHSQDHLSSKDSGTGSDAAVKRSIDDFTITMMAEEEAAAEGVSGRLEASDRSHPGSPYASDSRERRNVLDYGADFGESIEYARPLGIAAQHEDLEMLPMGGGGERQSFLSDGEGSPPAYGHRRHVGNGSGSIPPPSSFKCSAQNASFSANGRGGVGPLAAVDI